MRYTDRLQCAGCSLEFSDVKAWKEGASNRRAAQNPDLGITDPR
jgi:hypothetical protein